MEPTEQLKRKLVYEQIPWNKYCVLGFGGGNNDNYALELLDGKYSICYYERGQSSYCAFETESADEACNQYYEKVVNETVCVTMLPSLENAKDIQSRLSKAGVNSQINPIPESMFGEIMYQILVLARHVAQARQMILFPNLHYYSTKK